MFIVLDGQPRQQQRKTTKGMESMIEEALYNNDVTSTGIRNLLAKNDRNLLSTHAPNTCSVCDFSYIYMWCTHLIESYVKQCHFDK